MSNTGTPNQSGAKSFQRDSKLGTLLPLGFLTFGAGTMGVAVLTALTPPPVAFLAKLASVLDQVGLDKGPLLMFGVLSTAMGFALSKLEKSGRSGASAADAASFAQANASSMELQGEILSSVQAELGSIRHEISTARREAQEEKEGKTGGNGEGTDPLFRLAASLDQLGAQIDKRIDKARREMIEAVSGVAKSTEVSAGQSEVAFEKSVSDRDAIRMDIADLRAQLTRVAADVNNTKSVIADFKIAAPMAAAAVPQESSESSVEETSPTESKSAALPVELTDAADQEPSADPAPAAPLPASPREGSRSAEPQFEGFQFENEPEDKPEDEAAPAQNQEPKAPIQGVSMQSLGFSEPPAPIPKPSQDLGLIDEMHADTARSVDDTPPLFPDAFE